MQLRVDTGFLRTILGPDRLSDADVQAIARLAYLAAEIDFEEDEAEQATLDGAASQLWALAALPPSPVPPVSPLPLDDEERRQRIEELARQLSTRGTRELAYVLAYLLVVADHELAPVEGRFLDDLQRTLSVSDERASELALYSAERATPGVSTAERLEP